MWEGVIVVNPHSNCLFFCLFVSIFFWVTIINDNMIMVRVMAEAHVIVVFIFLLLSYWK